MRDEELVVNHNRPSRFKNEHGLLRATRREKWLTTKRDRNARPAQDLAERDFTAEAPHRLGVADTTCSPTYSGFLY